MYNSETKGTTILFGLFTINRKTYFNIDKHIYKIYHVFIDNLHYLWMRLPPVPVVMPTWWGWATRGRSPPMVGVMPSPFMRPSIPPVPASGPPTPSTRARWATGAWARTRAPFTNSFWLSSNRTSTTTTSRVTATTAAYFLCNRARFISGWGYYFWNWIPMGGIGHFPMSMMIFKLLTFVINLFFLWSSWIK